MNVQGYILSLSTPNTVEEYREKIKTGNYNDIDFIFRATGDYMVEYTAPMWALTGDIVFFYHTKTSIQVIKSVRRKINKEYQDADDYNELIAYNDQCAALYNQFGGTIYAVGEVSFPAQRSENEWQESHFRTQIFAGIENVTRLQYPIKLSEVEKVCQIARQRTITPVLGNAFMDLKRLVTQYTDIPCLKGKTALHTPIKDVAKGNWLEAANKTGRRYILEAQFRKYYADYLLLCLSDDNKIYSECACYKGGEFVGRVDNVIVMLGQYVPVEIKLYFDKSYFPQLQRYCELDEIKLNEKQTVQKNDIAQWGCMMIDNYAIADFYCEEDENALYLIEELDNIKSMADVRRIRKEIEEGYEE